MGGGERSAGGVVGKPFVKVDARTKVTGVMKFADDLVLPRMLHARMLRSTEGAVWLERTAPLGKCPAHMDGPSANEREG